MAACSDDNASVRPQQMLSLDRDTCSIEQGRYHEGAFSHIADRASLSAIVNVSTSLNRL
jgi:hypothetical protein